MLASRAAKLDDGDPWAHLALGWLASLLGALTMRSWNFNVRSPSIRTLRPP